MVSLTPQKRSTEVTDAAMNEGMVNGTMVLIPSIAGVYGAYLKNAKFRKFTNWQSRTAIAIMPALFVFALTSEHKLNHRMHEVAEETEHAMKSVEWAERQLRRESQLQQEPNKMKEAEELRKMYRQSVIASGVNVVPELQTYHKVANYIQANPFKCIAGLGVPSIAYIYLGQSGKEHLSFQLKILHTRVFGQAAVICSLLGIMGLKEMMDRRGKYVTEGDIDARVRQMENTRNDMMERLEHEANIRQQQMLRKK